MDRITGYVDLVSPNAVVGWIANIDHPERLEPVTCVGSNGSRLTFQPFVPRRDVCTALAMTGRFGFAIPAFLVESFGRSISFTDVNGEYLQNGQAIAVPQAVQPAAQGPTWVILHIQKTAGTSLRSALTRHTGPHETVLIYPDGFIGLSLDEFVALPAEQRAALRVVMGHTDFRIADAVPQSAEFITFLRDPLARIKSHYYHHLAQGSAIEVDGTVTDTAAIVANGLTGEFDNLMVRSIAGAHEKIIPIGALNEGHVEQAMLHIRSRFRFVGIVERLATHYPALAKATGLQLPELAHENACRLADTGEANAAVDWRRVMHLNRFDTMLYNQAQAEGLCGCNLAATRE